MNPITNDLPKVWPEPADGSNDQRGICLPHYATLLQEAKAVVGVVSGLSCDGVTWLQSWLEDNNDLSIKLILTIYPTGPTNPEVGALLLELITRLPDRLEVRAFPLEHVYDRGPNLLCLAMPEGKNPILVMGASEDLGLAQVPDAHVNVTLETDPLLVESFRRSFDWMWSKAGDFTEAGIARIPRLILPPGDAEGERMWREYQLLCRDAAVLDQASRPEARVDPKTGAVYYVTPEGEVVKTPTEEVGLPSFDSVREFVARLYTLGEQVTIDKHSRIKPLDAPVNPAVFGDQAQRQHGKVQRKVSLRVSAIDDNDLKEIERHRKRLRELVTRFSFGMADSDRWIPSRARPLFEKECTKLEQAGGLFMKQLLKGGVDALLEKRRDDVIRDLQGMAKDLRSEHQFLDRVVADVMQDIRGRLENAASGRFLPTLSYKRMGFSTTESEHASPWGSAYAFLLDVAFCPRKAITDMYFFRGLNFTQDKDETKDLYLTAMDIAGDVIVANRHQLGIDRRCLHELDVIEQIQQLDACPKDKCRLLMDLIMGVPVADQLTHQRNG